MERANQANDVMAEISLFLYEARSFNEEPALVVFS